MELEDRTSRTALEAIVMEGDGTQSGRLRKWVLAVNVAMVIAALLFFTGVVVRGRAGGILVFLSGSAVVFAGVAGLADAGGLAGWTGRRFGHYQNWIVRHSFATRTLPERRLLLLGRLLGAGTALAGVVCCVIGVALISGRLKSG